MDEAKAKSLELALTFSELAARFVPPTKNPKDKTTLLPEIFKLAEKFEKYIKD